MQPDGLEQLFGGDLSILVPQRKWTNQDDTGRRCHSRLARGGGQGDNKKEGLGRCLHPSSPGSAMMDLYPKYRKAKGRTENACPWHGRGQMWPGPGYRQLLLFFGRVEMSPLFSWGAGGDLGCSDPWWLLALLHCLGTMSNSLLSPMEDGGDSCIVPVGLGGMLRLE